MTPQEEQEPPEPASLGRWAVALGLAGLALAASWLLREPEPPAQRPHRVAEAPPAAGPSVPTTGSDRPASSQPPTSPPAAPASPAPAPRSAARAPATVEVLHRHTIGSCRGRLVATASELRYETDHAADRFVLPLAALETFDFDEATQKLRVKPRDGRTWNFTSAEPTGPSLRAFARQVDAARLAGKSGAPAAGPR